MIYFLDFGLRIRYCNPAWDRFARENGGECWLGERARGRALMSVIPEPLCRFFRRGICGGHQRAGGIRLRVLQRRALSPFPHADPAAARWLCGGQLDAHERRPRQLPCPPDPWRYLGSAACFVMCVQCRRTRHTSNPEHWDWVPAFVEHPPGPVIDGLCPACQETYYGASHHAKLECCG